MAKNTQPVAKKCKALGISPATMVILQKRQPAIPVHRPDRKNLSMLLS